MLRIAGERSSDHVLNGENPMELILIIVLVVLVFGGGGYWGRSRGHW